MGTPHERIGRYELVEPLARGGMAEILLARASGPVGFERLVVVKRILPHLAHEHEFVTRFLDEARIAATLHHPNIVQVQEILETEGSYAIAMEYLHGADVSQLWKAAHALGRPIPLAIAIHIARETAAGLHYAHERSTPAGEPLAIVHRDVSPQNVIVTYEGAVKLVDFGIARAAQRLTTTAHTSLQGKLPYMSPEQCRAGALDRRSDVFSLAVMLWELLAMRRLYGSISEYDVLKAIVEADAPPPSRFAKVPRELDRIVARGLARDVERRYPTALGLQLDLERFVRDHACAITARELGEYVRTTAGERPLPAPTITTGALDETVPAQREVVAPAPGDLDARTESLSQPTPIARRPQRTPRIAAIAIGASAAIAVVAIAIVAIERDPTPPPAEERSPTPITAPSRTGPPVKPVAASTPPVAAPTPIKPARADPPKRREAWRTRLPASPPPPPPPPPPPVEVPTSAAGSAAVERPAVDERDRLIPP